MHSFAERFWVVQAREDSMAMADRCYQPDGGFNGDHAPNGLGRSGGVFTRNPIGPAPLHLLPAAGGRVYADRDGVPWEGPPKRRALHRQSGPLPGPSGIPMQRDAPR